MSLRAELVRLGLRWFVKRKIGPATTLEECVLSAQCLEGARGTDLALDEPAQSQAHELGA